MALQSKWKAFGQNAGNAFRNFGKSIGKTAEVVFADKENKTEENGHTELSNAWRETGKSFGQAGKSLGKAAQGTAQKAVGAEEAEPTEKNENPKE